LVHNSKELSPSNEDSEAYLNELKRILLYIGSHNLYIFDLVRVYVSNTSLKELTTQQSTAHPYSPICTQKCKVNTEDTYVLD